MNQILSHLWSMAWSWLFEREKSRIHKPSHTAIQYNLAARLTSVRSGALTPVWHPLIIRGMATMWESPPPADDKKSSIVDVPVVGFTHAVVSNSEQSTRAGVCCKTWDPQARRVRNCGHSEGKLGVGLSQMILPHNGLNKTREACRGVKRSSNKVLKRMAPDPQNETVGTWRTKYTNLEDASYLC